MWRACGAVTGPRKFQRRWGNNAQHQRQDAPPDNPNIPSPEKRTLEANEKDIKKKVYQLYQLATELKAEVDKTDSSKVLSLSLLKKTEEIEKLARDIRNRSKG